MLLIHWEPADFSHDVYCWACTRAVITFVGHPVAHASTNGTNDLGIICQDCLAGSSSLIRERVLARAQKYQAEAEQLRAILNGGIYFNHESRTQITPK
jgi:hypothetical protein